MNELALHDNLETVFPGTLTDTALVLPEDLSYERWLSIGETLRRMEKAVQWWIGDWWAFGEHRWGDKAWQAVSGYDYDAIKQMAWVSKHFQPLITPEAEQQTGTRVTNWETGAPTRHENLSWTHHREVATLPSLKAESLLDKAEHEGWSTRQLAVEVRWERYLADRPELVNPPVLAELGRFSVILADPPWQYENQGEHRQGILEYQYPSMSIADLCALPVSDVAYDDAMLFLWTTSPKLEEAFEVVKAWGFNYRTSMVWVKDRIAMGYYARQQHELLLIAKRGEVPTPAPDARPPSVLYGAVTEHSRKPEQVYELIEGMYPKLPKVELFARAPRPGWKAWGNEQLETDECKS